MSASRSGNLCLALCSATRTASAALLDGDRVVVEHSAVADRHQAESLLPLVDRVLVDTSTKLGDLACIGLSIGPGSFTSLRIGVATVKGLVYGTELPVVAVSTLQAIVEAAAGGLAPVSRTAAIIGTLNAQRGEVYAAAFAGSEHAFAPREDVLPELVYDASELASHLPAGCVLVGEGAAIVAEDLRAERGDEISFVEDKALEPTASSIGRLAVAQWQRSGGALAADLAPRYVRRAEAEVTRTAERFEPPA